jgi:hypothetical protein
VTLSIVDALVMGVPNFWNHCFVKSEYNYAPLLTALCAAAAETFVIAAKRKTPCIALTVEPIVLKEKLSVFAITRRKKQWEAKK